MRQTILMIEHSENLQVTGRSLAPLPTARLIEPRQFPPLKIEKSCSALIAPVRLQPSSRSIEKILIANADTLMCLLIIIFVAFHILQRQNNGATRGEREREREKKNKRNAVESS